MKNNGKGFSIAALVLGIISIVLFWMDGAAFVCGIVGLVLGLTAKKAAKAAGASTGLVTTGIILCIVGVCLSGLTLLVCSLCGGCSLFNSCAATNMFGDIDGFMEDILGDMF